MLGFAQASALPFLSVCTTQEALMTPRLGRQAVVIGAGMAGMPSARVLADYFDQVIVLESDTLPADASPRQGTPQSKHLHVLLAGGQQALSRLFPGFEQSLAAAGAQPLSVTTDYWVELPRFDVFPQRDLGFRTYSLTRPLVERVVREKVTAIGNIEIRERCRAQKLVTTDDGAAVKGVVSTHSTGETEEIPADLVIDASGTGQLTLNLLAALGLQPPEESTVRVEVGYSTTIFEIPDDAPSDWKFLMTMADPPANRRGAVLTTIEGNCWLLGLLGSHDTKPPEDEAGFLEYAQRLRTQTVYNSIKGAKRRSDITRSGFKASRWRHFEKLDRFPKGLIPFGDTICRFNPTYGQGMSVAAKEACLLLDLLQAAAQEGKELCSVSRDFLIQAQPIIDAPWATAVIPDFLDPLTEGERPPDLGNALKFTGALTKIAYEDPAIHKLMYEVRHMLKPRSVLREPEIAERVRAVMAEA
jgi:2-polyprenyl-6-methoxyphenol hydroxylase-like FAD-dependent oxidoreductase